jgi:hypothetical protein
MNPKMETSAQDEEAFFQQASGLKPDIPQYDGRAAVLLLQRPACPLHEALRYVELRTVRIDFLRSEEAFMSKGGGGQFG